MEFPHLTHPFTMLVCGPSNSGKTFFVKRIIEEKIIKPFPPRIIWCYGAYQSLFNEMNNVEFYDGLPSEIDTISNALIVLDDLMSELCDNNKLSKLFTKGSHHRNLSVIFIVQNMYQRGKEMRNISLNTSYICCFNNLRDKLQISCLARQMYPGKSKFLLECFADACSTKYGYIFIDLKQETDERLRLRSGLFPGDEKNIVYLPR